MKYIVAVSGGVDSVVLLDMLAASNEHDLVVAHFDHGIRDDSKDDARFVAALAHAYGLPFETRREELGAKASEETARQRRYHFLHQLAKKYSAEIVTAHHEDDVIETIAINIERGTGWRGLAVMSGSIYRPLLDMTKFEIYEYALRHDLEWVEDVTNTSRQYLRNRIRFRIAQYLTHENKKLLVAAWLQQREIRAAIAGECDTVLGTQNVYSRYFFTHIDEQTALELLWSIVEKHHASLTRPQRKRLLHAIKVLPAGATFQAGNGISLHLTKREFVVKTE